MADEDLHSTDPSVPLSPVKKFYQINININTESLLMHFLVLTEGKVIYMSNAIYAAKLHKKLKNLTFVVQFAYCFSIRPIKGEINKDFFFHSFEQLLSNRFGKLGETLYDFSSNLRNASVASSYRFSSLAERLDRGWYSLI